jgi:NADPH-dependent 2,4-dienoyl-CoA reductase/sulfur reductase-like enzyme/nitrite reductase/ring-hydroxylating ferredoxin subunit
MQRVASVSQIPHDRGLKVEVNGEKLLLVRDGASVNAYSAVCPHAGAPLEEGAVCQGRIVCPWHKAAFCVSDGSLVEPPALEGLTRYRVSISGDDVFVDPEPEPIPSPETPHDDRTFVIVGAGAAGASAAGALREFGFGGRILLIGREPGEPFDRTALSKFVLAGEMKPEEAPPLRPADFYTKHGIERIEAEVVRMIVARRQLVLADGRDIAFDNALVCTGAAPTAPKLPGLDKAGVHFLRTCEDTKAILQDLRQGAHAIVLGSSFIGLEVASCLRAQDVHVTVVSPEAVPFARQFGEAIGRSIRALHEANGVIFASSAKAASLEGEGQVRELLLEDGRHLPADLVVIGVGVRPVTSFIEGASFADDGGLVVDEHLCAAPGIYAAGDVAVFPLPPDGEPTRIEHWRVAQAQARVAAANMAGRKVAYDSTPLFWTYHYGKNYEYLGHANSWSEQLVFGDIEKQDFVSLLLQGGRVAAVVACERQRLTAVLAERMRNPLMRSEAIRMIDALS